MNKVYIISIKYLGDVYMGNNTKTPLPMIDKGVFIFFNSMLYEVCLLFIKPN